MPKIKLSNGQYTLVDEEDLLSLVKYSWHCVNGYAKTSIGGRKNKKTIVMHRIILSAKPGEFVDHINHNTLDNRKSNLRICTKSQNAMNMRININRKNTKYKGLSPKGKSWRVRIKHNYKEYYIGMFSNEIEAAKAYDKKAKELFGEFAMLNFPES